MIEDEPPAGGAPGEPERKPVAWKVDREESLANLPARLPQPDEREEGALVYVDEQGRRRRLPADLAGLSPDERRAAVAALSSALGAPDPDYARLAAVERLTEMRAAGTLSEENYKRERKRLLGEG